jgi:hypothetical protein
MSVNKEEKRLYDIEYAKKNKEKRDKCSKLYYQENRVKCMLYSILLP